LAALDAFILPASDGHAVADITVGQVAFRSSEDGTWKMGGEMFSPFCPGESDESLRHCQYLAVGIDGTWTRVPGPSTLALLGVGLVGLTSFRRRVSTAH